VIFPVAKIKPWAVEKWNSYDQSGHTFSPQNTLEFLVEFFKEIVMKSCDLSWHSKSIWW
jgi:hypothetical protein